MKIEQISQILDKQDASAGLVGNADRMGRAIKEVLTEDARMMSKGKAAYEQARQKDFERKMNEDMMNPRKMTFTEMVSRYL